MLSTSYQYSIKNVFCFKDSWNYSLNDKRIKPLLNKGFVGYNIMIFSYKDHSDIHELNVNIEKKIKDFVLI